MAHSDRITPDLWNLAKERLTDAEKTQLPKAVPDSTGLSTQLLALVETGKKRCVDRRWKFKRPNGEVVVIRDVFEKIARWLQKFKEVGDVATQYDPAHAALPWAAVRMLLQIAINDMESLSAVAEGIETVSRLVTRCAVLENIHLAPHCYPLPESQAMLQEALISLYTAILSWLLVAGSYYDRRTAKRLLRSVVSSGPALIAISEKERQVSDLTPVLQSQLASNTSGVVESLDISVNSLVSMLRDLEHPMVRIVSTLDRIEKRLETKERQELARWLSMVQHKQAHRKVHDGLIQDTGKWLLRRDEYMQWCESSTSSTLWLHGIPGCGKSKLASLVVQTHLDRIVGKPNAAPIAYVYCSRNLFNGIKPKIDSVAILGSILKQLAFFRPAGGVHHSVWDEYSTRARDAEEDGLDPTPLSLDDCGKLVISIASDCPITIIVDGLDEADGDIRDLLDIFRHIVEESQNVVKLFISCRNDSRAPISTHLNNVKQVAVKNADNTGDVHAFVEKMVSESIDKKRLLRGRVSVELQKVITNKLVQTSDCMFLWANLQLEQLCDPRYALEADVINELEALRTPHGLLEILDRMYERVEQYPPRAKYVTKSIFTWLVVSERRLSRSELLDVISSSQSQDVYDAAQQSSLCEDDIRDLCRGFIDCVGESDSFTFSHESIREYIVAHEDFNPAILSYLAVSQCLSHLTLRYKKIQRTQILTPHLVSGTSSKPQQPLDGYEYRSRENEFSSFWRYAVIYWPYHYTEIRDKAVVKMADFDISPFVFDHSGLFFLLWQQDVIQAIGDGQADAKLDSAAETLGDLTSLEASHQAALFVAAVYGITAMLEQLANTQTKIDWDAKNHCGLSGVYLSARYGRDDALRFLLRSGASADTNTAKFGNPIEAAAYHGHTSAVAILLEHHANPLVQGLFPTSLHAAIKGGNDSTIQLLLRDYSCHTSGDLESLVEAASYGGHHAVVKILLQRYYEGLSTEAAVAVDCPSCSSNLIQASLCGAMNEDFLLPLFAKTLLANVNQQGGLFGNALQAACFGGSIEWVRFLLKLGADVNSNGSCGSSLRAASLGGHDEVVKLLLRNKSRLSPDDLDAIEACALKDRLSTLKLLVAYVEKTASYDTRKRYLNAALRTARSRGHNRAIEFLTISCVDLGPPPRPRSGKNYPTRHMMACHYIYPRRPLANILVSDIQLEQPKKETDKTFVEPPHSSDSTSTYRHLNRLRPPRGR